MDRHFDAPGTWSLLECPSCRLMWLDPMPDARDLDRIYADYYTHDTHADAADSREDPLVLRAIRRGIPAHTLGYRDSVPDLRERILGACLSWIGPLRELARRGTMGLTSVQRGELLDVGCGDGTHLAHMRNLGWGVSGVERDPRGLAVARARLGDAGIHANLEAAANARPEGYDVVTLSHVIEHLLDPIETLRLCLACLREGGLLVVATPNLASLGHARFGRSWLHLDPPRHVQLYRPETLCEVVRRAGFEIERVETPASSAHFVWRASTQIARSGRLPGLHPPAATPATLLSSVLYWGREYALTRMGKPCGEELLLFAHRPGASSC